LRGSTTTGISQGNAIFVIVGDVDPQATLDKVKALLDRLPASLAGQSHHGGDDRRHLHDPDRYARGRGLRGVRCRE
jgi:predicted Zn-dependent peptidase